MEVEITDKRRTEMFEDARVGDRVWAVRSGWGSIVKITLGAWPICVKFDSYNGVRTTYVYTIHGKEISNDITPILFWDEIDMTPPPTPKRKVTKYINIYQSGYPDKVHGTIFDSGEKANDNIKGGLLICLELDIEE